MESEFCKILVFKDDREESCWWENIEMNMQLTNLIKIVITILFHYDLQHLFPWDWETHSSKQIIFS